LRHELPPEVRLFAITGVLGGFTTFSAFSNEVVSLLAQGRPGWAGLTAAAHVAGSLALTALGILTVRTIT
jgi:CrcB protein